MRKDILIISCIMICAVLNAESGEEMLRRAVSTNPSNSWNSGDMQKGQRIADKNNMSAYLWSNGAMYFGNFYGNQLHDYGIYIVPEGYQVANCPNAKYYVGDWSNGKKSGIGTCYDASGKLIYYGEFKDGKPVGTYPMTGYENYKFQTIDYTNGDKFIGETENGKRHGYGVYAWNDGRIWIGNWTDNVRNGKGIDIASNGTLTTGTWQGDTHTPEQTSVASSSGSSSSSSSAYSYSQNNTIPCYPCGQTGRCFLCGGMGGQWLYTGYLQCTSCFGTGVCSFCYGLGWQTITGVTPPSSGYSGSGGSFGGDYFGSSSSDRIVCSTCNGTRLCKYCSGGRGTGIDNSMPNGKCGVCLGTGLCPGCDGKGYY